MNYIIVKSKFVMSCGIFNIVVECLNKKFFLLGVVRLNGSFWVLYLN